MDIEEVPDEDKLTLPVDIYQGLDAYQAGDMLARLGCPQKLISALSRSMVSFWDLFISTGMQTAEINPWRVTPAGNPTPAISRPRSTRPTTSPRSPAWSSPSTRTTARSSRRR